MWRKTGILLGVLMFLAADAPLLQVNAAGGAGAVKVSGAVEASGVTEVSGAAEASGVAEVSGAVEASGGTEVLGAAETSVERKTVRNVSEVVSEQANTTPNNRKTRLTIDNVHVFDGMEKAYKNGYVPTVSEDTAIVVLPLMADSAIQDEKIEVQADLGEIKNSPFVYKNYRKTFSREEIKPTGEEDAVSIFYIRFDLALHAERKNGTYPVVLDVAGKDGQGKAFSQKFTIYISITDGVDDGDVGTDHGSSDTGNDDGGAGSGGTGTGSGDAGTGSDNPGSGNLDSGEGNGDSGSDVDGAAPGSDSDTDGSDADTGDDLVSGIGDDTGSYGSGYGGDYGSSSGGQSGTDTPTSQPIVLVSGSSFASGTVTAGQEFTVTVYLKNTSEKKNVQNMVVTITYDTEKFTLKEESDTIYIPSLKKGEVMELPITLESHFNTPEGTYKIDLGMSYDNSEAETLTSSGSIYIPVKQELNVELTMPKIAEKVTAGDTLPLSFQIMNLGRSKAYNVRCEVSGYGLFPVSTAFVGDMEAGTAQTAEMNVFIGAKNQSEDYTGTEPYGETSGLVIMYYEDEQGQEYTEEFSFTTMIEKAVVVSGSETQEEEKTAGQWWVSVLVVGVILVVIGGYVIVRRRLRSE